MTQTEQTNKIDLFIPEAFEFLLTKKSRYKVMYGGRGGAKSHNIARALIILGMQKPTRIICAREVQKSIKDSVHTLLSDIIQNHGLSFFYEVQRDIIRGASGTEFKFRGLKHNNSDLKSLEGADICWLEEAENISHKSYEILIPTLRKDNSEIWVSFNPRNLTDPTYQRFVASDDKDIIKTKVSWRDNPFFPKVLLAELRKLEKTDPQAYNHVWEGEPDVRKTGFIYARELSKARDEGRICNCPYDPEYEVFTAWDLGFGDSTAIWWLQFVGRELRWLEYYENSQELTQHYVDVVKSKRYNYMDNGHFLPFDAASSTLNGSVANKMRNLGLKCTVLPRTKDTREDRDLLSNVMGYSVFDSTLTKDGIFALENYHFLWDEDKGVFKKEPYHDWSSHGADAARYAAVASQRIKHVNFANKPNQNAVNEFAVKRSGWMS